MFVAAGTVFAFNPQRVRWRDPEECSYASHMYDDWDTLTPNDGGSTPTLQFVSEAPYAPAGFFLVEGASLPRRMLTDAIL